MDYTKENAVNNYFEKVIKRSWTWERLTDSEKAAFLKCHFNRIKGNAKQRIETLCLMYEAFLLALGYSPIKWREADPDSVPGF